MSPQTAQLQSTTKSDKLSDPANTSSLFRTFGECCAALPKMGENLVGAYPAAPGGLWVADVSRCASSPARGRRGESAVTSMRGAPWGKRAGPVPQCFQREIAVSIAGHWVEVCGLS